MAGVLHRGSPKSERAPEKSVTRGLEGILLRPKDRIQLQIAMCSIGKLGLGRIKSHGEGESQTQIAHG